MPNLKIFADSAIRSDIGAALKDELPEFARLLMERLEVPRAACQVALVWVDAPADQPALNIELSIMPSAKRQRPLLEELGRTLQDRVIAIGIAKPAIRISQLDPETFVTVK